MSRTLTLATASVNSQPPSLTIFAPADDAFPFSGQLSSNRLRYHLLPTAFHLRSLKSLPYGAKIATLLAGRSLTVTSLPADGVVSLNNVTLAASPIYDDGSLIVFGIKKLFDPNFQISGPIRSLRCLAPRNPNGDETAAFYPFDEASEVLRSNGFSVVASFLEVQFLKYHTTLTVFAPVDQAMVSRIGDLSQYSSIFGRHVAPCKLSWDDLANLDDEAVLVRTNLEGFMINISRYDGVLVLSGVPVIMPEMYRNEWLVVHGISGVLEFPVSSPEQVVASTPDSEPEAVDNNSSGEEAEPAENVIEKEPASPEFEDGGDSELIGNMNGDGDAISYRVLGRHTLTMLVYLFFLCV
ncbi:putative fasciclin-like arabinogalactan protein 20 [Argentina anserina]|uniref:putative fasciclin-like arabinogalactan protein 20 n=1 Tax=Argentina anserina TaxID=57926 RepID=UPI0021768D0D|nr:putative fasciclin-like arabinogalactan protein 20 [Potentilla anserina]